MKRTVILLLIASVFAACAPKNESRPAVVQRQQRDPFLQTGGGLTGGGGGVPSGNRTWGAIISGGDLTQMTQQLVSATMDPNSLGRVSGVANDPSGTGIRFWGDIKLNPAQPGAQVQPQGSKLRIVIWDQYAADGSAPEYPIYIETNVEGGMVTGNLQNLRFEDQYGLITMSGQVQGNMYVGNVSFQNKKRFDGGQPASGNLGQFQVQACGFFNCQ